MASHLNLEDTPIEHWKLRLVGAQWPENSEQENQELSLDKLTSEGVVVSSPDEK